ncbi:TetR/AcrR family transcriptional regulator [Clostridium sp. YIM B02505]|uniref:TetR/AcrR family transcriptional regulator n=1 Tax=Clostridium yunnanense TaxID=2800325 RepID=A0ABS1ERF1_9CLOT|nr:TetR/AcrR family transcriptional regulator [Clostridium yunnanense]MBK1811910.1 TetR/AcrR family transcriptional regulator [Clostridium yunnanense]
MSESWHKILRNKNRLEIITAGRELFLKNNFINVNIKDVCMKAGVSRVTFYKHFKSIDDLIFEVQIDILQCMTDTISEASTVGTSGLEKLKNMLYSWVNFARENKDQMKFITLFDIYYEAYDSNEELKIKYENFTKLESNNFLDNIIRSGIEDRSFKKDINVMKTGFYIFQTMMGVLQRVSYTKIPVDCEGITSDDIVLSIIDMIINSVKTEKNT